eukprot:COSAG02_NODE_3078_length_7417_cov_563.409538_1_plen_76_part_00
MQNTLTGRCGHNYECNETNSVDTDISGLDTRARQAMHRAVWAPPTSHGGYLPARVAWERVRVAAARVRAGAALHT